LAGQGNRPTRAGCGSSVLLLVALGEPGGGEEFEELVEFGLVFAADDDRFGAQAVDESVEARARFAFGSFGAGSFLRITPVSPYLLDSRHGYLFQRTEPIRGGRRQFSRRRTQINADKRR
jgi:hypothetical protein